MNDKLDGKYEDHGSPILHKLLLHQIPFRPSFIDGELKSI